MVKRVLIGAFFWGGAEDWLQIERGLAWAACWATFYSKTPG
jgi:hypothetical protein